MVLLIDLSWYYALGVDLEMNEDTDGMNDSENNSEVVILPDQVHVDEVLLSGQFNARDDPCEYSRKLDEKLRDLGLWEDGMTINQKEELLAVVVISCETAEQEENKRKLVKEYLESAQSLSDEIDFTLQQSAWLASETNYLCGTGHLPKDSHTDQSKLVSYTNFDASTSTNFGGFESVSLTEEHPFPSSPEIFEDATAYAELLFEAQSSASDLAEPAECNILSSVPDNKEKLAVSQSTVQVQKGDNTKCDDPHEKQLPEPDDVFLENALRNWRPCLSPQSKPLSELRCNKEQNQGPPSPSTVKKKMDKYLELFNHYQTRLRYKPSSSSSENYAPLTKPYLLHGSMAKKAVKVDEYDLMVGVSGKAQMEDAQKSNTSPPRVKSAFHPVQPSISGLVSLTDPSSLSKTTRSGTSYGPSHALESSKGAGASEIVLDDIGNESHVEDSPDMNIQEKVVGLVGNARESNHELPQFSNLQPDLKTGKVVALSPVFAEFVNPPNVTVTQSSFIPHNNLDRLSAGVPKTVNATEGGYSSDSSSSLIDVETIADDEITEFVPKKRQSSQKPSLSKTSKKLKRNDS